MNWITIWFLVGILVYVSSEDAGQKPENEKTEKKETVKEKLKDLAKDAKRAKDYYDTKSPFYYYTTKAWRPYEKKPKPTWSPYEVKPTKWFPSYTKRHCRGVWDYCDWDSQCCGGLYCNKYQCEYRPFYTTMSPKKTMEEYRDEEEEVEKRQEWGKWGKTKN